LFIRHRSCIQNAQNVSVDIKKFSFEAISHTFCSLKKLFSHFQVLSVVFFLSTVYYAQTVKHCTLFNIHTFPLWCTWEKYEPMKCDFSTSTFTNCWGLDCNGPLTIHKAIPRCFIHLSGMSLRIKQHYCTSSMDCIRLLQYYTRNLTVGKCSLSHELV
jgi:hypothetical protein